MKALSKFILLMGMAVALTVSPTFADGKKENDSLKDAATVTSSEMLDIEEGFYFPEFDLNMDAFWSSMEPMHNSCRANSWLGGTASATCLNRQNCICTSTFVSVECHCE